MARLHDVTVYQMPQQSGPAAARNYGARKAKGDIFFFVDSDVAVKKDSVARIANVFRNNTDIAAVFGSYDDNPLEKNFVSQYKNIFHHFIHQQSSEEAVTFWAGCGAIRSKVFHEMGGFNEKLYSIPSIEDIELGSRMKRKRYRIWLDKKLQVKHLKKWNLFSLLSTDIFHRAIPWTRLMLENREIINDLNLQASQKISASLVGLAMVILPFVFFELRLFYIVFILLGLVIILNRKLYGFFLQRKGLKFTLMAFPLHLLYFLYSGITFVLCSLGVFLKRRGLSKPRL